MQSRELSFLITPPFLVNTVNLDFLAYVKIKMRQILSKQLHLITLVFNNVKYPWRNPNTRRNMTMFESRSIYFKTISNPLTRARTKVFFVALVFICETSWSRHGLWSQFCCRQWLGRVHYVPIETEIYTWNVCFDLCDFLNYVIPRVIKGINSGCQCIVEIRIVPWLHPCTCLLLTQGPPPGLRHSPLYLAWLWFPQCTCNHSQSL